MAELATSDHVEMKAKYPIYKWGLSRLEKKVDVNPYPWVALLANWKLKKAVSQENKPVNTTAWHKELNST